jgi:hypothetical protein
MNNYAKTTVILAKLAVAPIQNFIAKSWGVLITKHFFSLLNTAVVRSDLTLDPCPSSVSENDPISSIVLALSMN